VRIAWQYDSVSIATGQQWHRDIIGQHWSRIIIVLAHYVTIPLAYQ